MCRLLQSVVMWTGVWPWACVFFPHDCQTTATARVQTETRPNRTTHLRFLFVVMPLSSYCFLFIDTPNGALRPMNPGLAIIFQTIIMLVLRTENLVPHMTGIPHNERFCLAPINQNFENSRIKKKSSRQCEGFQYQFDALFQHGTPPKLLHSLVFILRYISSIRSPQIPVASRKHACHMRVIGLRCVVLKWPARVRRQLGYPTGADTRLYARLSGRHNLELFAELNSLPRNEASHRLANLTCVLRQWEPLDRELRTLSTGNIHRTFSCAHRRTKNTRTHRPFFLNLKNARGLYFGAERLP